MEEKAEEAEEDEGEEDEKIAVSPPFRIVNGQRAHASSEEKDEVG